MLFVFKGGIKMKTIYNLQTHFRNVRFSKKVQYPCLFCHVSLQKRVIIYILIIFLQLHDCT